jgi:low temperature requirement protein LtrA
MTLFLQLIFVLAVIILAAKLAGYFSARLGQVYGLQPEKSVSK